MCLHICPPKGPHVSASTESLLPPTRAVTDWEWSSQSPRLGKPVSGQCGTHSVFSNTHHMKCTSSQTRPACLVCRWQRALDRKCADSSTGHLSPTCWWATQPDTAHDFVPTRLKTERLGTMWFLMGGNLQQGSKDGGSLDSSGSWGGREAGSGWWGALGGGWRLEYLLHHSLLNRVQLPLCISTGLVPEHPAYGTCGYSSPSHEML
jgi:hypothetical protein